MSDGQPSFADRALAAMLELLHEGALLFEGDALTCRFASARAADILGVPAGSLTGRTRDDLLASVTPADEATARALAALRASQPGERRRETVALQGDPARVLEWSTAPLDQGGPFRGRIDILADRTVEALLRVELDRAYARMAQTSILDDLTGLSNRKHFESEVDREHRRSQRSWASYAVARIDVDGMAQLNADIGEEAGDTLLRRTGEVLKAARREYDLVARWENDELIVLLPGIDERAVKAVLARSIAAMRDAAREVAAREVTFSAGVAVWIPPSVESSEEVLQRAATALQAAQLLGRGHVEIDARMIEWKDDPAAGE